MSAAVMEKSKLGSLGTNWALTQLEDHKPCNVMTYKTGHYFQGEKEAENKQSKLVILGTVWTLTQFGACDPSSVKTYETGHYFQRGKEAKINDR
jgi:hypothetical protein